MDYACLNSKYNENYKLKYYKYKMKYLYAKNQIGGENSFDYSGVQDKNIMIS